MKPRLMGIETEYAVADLGSQYRRVFRPRFLRWILERARARWPSIPDAHSSGVYLGNGSRFYIDCGMHPEMSTPECANPWDAVRYVRAGERLIEELLAELRRSDPEFAEVAAFRSNVDYSGTLATWGCHESYLHQAAPEDLPDQVIPHLVTRIIYSGAGGFDSRSRQVRPVMSPRAFHFERAMSHSSTSARGIYHTKDEPLSRGGYHRFHVLCGESLCSDLAAWLKVGTTALVVAMVEAGLRPGEGWRLRYPVQSFHILSRCCDPGVTLFLDNHRPTTALEVQMRCLELAEDYADAPWMPDWAGDVCREWRRVLDALGRAPESLDLALDWRIKRVLFDRHCERRRFEPDDIKVLNRIVMQLAEDLSGCGVSMKIPLSQTVSESQGPVAIAVHRTKRFAEARGADWGRVLDFLKLQEELLEIDNRFAQLGEAGIFGAMDRAGLLAHRVPGVDRIEEAMTEPPKGSRAFVRGRSVRHLSNRGEDALCDWRTLWNLRKGQMLDLSNPLESEEDWTPIPGHQRDKLAALMLRHGGSHEDDPRSIQRIVDRLTNLVAHWQA